MGGKSTGLGSGIQQASQNYLQQQAQNGDPNAAGVAAGSNALAAGLQAMKNKPVDMTAQANMPNKIPTLFGDTPPPPLTLPGAGAPPPPSLFVPSGNPITSPMNGTTGLTMHQPITSPMFNPGSTGFTMNPPITSPMNGPSAGTPMPMFKPSGPAQQPITSPMNRAGNLFG